MPLFTASTEPNGDSEVIAHLPDILMRLPATLLLSISSGRGLHYHPPLHLILSIFWLWLPTNCFLLCYSVYFPLSFFFDVSSSLYSFHLLVLDFLSRVFSILLPFFHPLFILCSLISLHPHLISHPLFIGVCTAFLILLEQPVGWSWSVGWHERGTQHTKRTKQSAAREDF